MNHVAQFPDAGQASLASPLVDGMPAPTSRRPGAEFSREPGQPATEIWLRSVGPQTERRQTLRLRLTERKMIQWIIAYIAAACVVLQVLESLGDIWDLPIAFQRGVSLGLGLGLSHAVVFAWYHGEKGRQRVCALELICVVLLSVLATMVIWLVCV
jgi:hypothetical protein